MVYIVVSEETTADRTETTMTRSGYTQDSSDTSTARFFVRGYFDGSGQHFTAIYDLVYRDYLKYHPRQIALFRNPAEAVEFLHLHGYI